MMIYLELEHSTIEHSGSIFRHCNNEALIIKSTLVWHLKIQFHIVIMTSQVQPSKYFYIFLPHNGNSKKQQYWDAMHLHVDLEQGYLCLLFWKLYKKLGKCLVVYLGLLLAYILKYKKKFKIVYLIKVHMSRKFNAKYLFYIFFPSCKYENTYW